MSDPPTPNASPPSGGEATSESASPSWGGRERVSASGWGAQLRTSMSNRNFKFERRIPLALLFGFLLQTGGALFWAGAAAERIAEVERETRANAGAVERVFRLEAEVAAMHETRVRIETKLDRIGAPRAGARN